MSLTELAASTCRLDLLERLLEEGSTRGRDLEKGLEYDGSTVRRNLKTLRETGWVESDGDSYRPRESRVFILESLLKAARTMDAYDGADGFWSEHDLSPVPDGLLRDLDMLRGAQAVSGTTTDPHRPLEVSGEKMLESSAVKVVSPSFARKYIEMHRQCFENGIDLDLVLTDEAVDLAMEDPEATELWRRHSDAGGLSLYHGEGFRLVLAVGDDYLALNLPRTGQKTIDLSTMLLAEGQDAVEWGERLFRHYRERAEPVGRLGKAG